MNIDAAFPSKYLKGADLNGKTVRVTIERMEIEEVGDGDRKPVLYFAGKDKGLALNRINADTISSSFGHETDDWAGKIIEIYFDPNVYYGPKKVGGLRVRVPRVSAAPRHEPTRASVQHSDERAPPLDDDEIPF